MSTTFKDIEKERGSLIDERARHMAEHSAWIAKCDARINELSERAVALSAGVDLERIDRARKVLFVEGDCTVAAHKDVRDSRASAIASAKQQLAENVAKLQETYIGVKNYAGFGDQREDHKYGYGPKHGHIVFRIGLTTEARRRDLSGEEIEDALYMLHILPALAKAGLACLQ